MALVRISVANLVVGISVIGTECCYKVGILSGGALRRGFQQYQALGGAAQLTAHGVKMLETEFRASQFEKDISTGYIDARFVVDEKKLSDVLRRFELFSGFTNGFEQDSGDDIRHELCDPEIPGIPPILSAAEASAIKIIYDSVVRQPEPKTGPGTSLRVRQDMPTRRLFRRYNLWAPRVVVMKIVKSPAIRVLTSAELATTEGGSCRGHTSDGVDLADNLFI